MSSARIMTIFGCGDCANAREEAKVQPMNTKGKMDVLKMFRLLVFLSSDFSVRFASSGLRRSSNGLEKSSEIRKFRATLVNGSLWRITAVRKVRHCLTPARSKPTLSCLSYFSLFPFSVAIDNHLQRQPSKLPDIRLQARLMPMYAAQR